MNILFINSIQMFGGGEVWMLRTLSGLKERGHRVALLCRPGVELASRAQEIGIDTFTVSMRGDFDPVTILRTAVLIRKQCFDIVLTNMDKELRFAGLAAKLARHCHVFPRRGIDYPLKNRIHYRFTYNVLAKVVIANSKATKKALLKNADWLDPERVHVIYNGINPAPFMTPAGADLRSELGLPRTAKLIGFAGQLDERKGLDYLLPAFFSTRKFEPDAHLVLAGAGPRETEINQFIQRFQLQRHVHLIGFVKQIEKFMQSIDIFVLPSLWEGFGIVLIEAMAAGKPCITTAVSSMPEIVLHQETGLVVEPQNADALSDAMIQLLGDQELARRMGKAGKNRVYQKFTIERMLDQLELLFEESGKKRS